MKHLGYSSVACGGYRRECGSAASRTGAGGTVHRAGDLNRRRVVPEATDVIGNCRHFVVRQ